MNSKKERIFVCPDCGSDNITFERLYIVESDLNTKKIIYDGPATDDYDIRCQSCNFHCENIIHLTEDIVSRDEDGDIIWRKSEETITYSPEYLKIIDFEKIIRDYISDNLEDYYGTDWWQKGVPEKIRKRSEGAKNSQTKKWSSIDPKLLHYINYVLFSDYIRIIADELNWNRIFKKKIKTQEKIIVYMNDLMDIRNEVMHRGNLNEEEKRRLDYYIKELTNILI